MSSGAEPPSIRPQAARDPETQNPNQVTQSTILYLLHEATMLARPAATDNCLDAGQEPKHYSVSHKSPLQAISFLKSNQSQLESDSPCTSTCSKSARFSAQCSSPWEVMSLINLQCERLLHSSDLEEDDASLSPALSTQASDAAALGSGLGSVSPGVALVCPIGLAREGASCIGASQQMGDMKEGCVSGSEEATESPCSPNNSITDESDPSQTCVSVMFGDAVGSGFGDSGSLSSKQEEEKVELKKPCSGSVVALQPGSPAPDDIPVPQLELLPAEQHLYPARPSEITVAYLKSSSGLTLDFNSNLCLTFDPQEGGNQPESSSQAVSLILSSETSQADDSLSSLNGRPAASEPTADNTSRQEGPIVDRSASSASQWRTRTPRKQPCPTRSVDMRGGGVQGVTFRIHTELDDNKEQCRLLITSKYSDELFKSVRKSRVRSRSSQSSLRSSSSDEESDPSSGLHSEYLSSPAEGSAAAQMDSGSDPWDRWSTFNENKMCASCRTKKTPLWRDAEDGTPLCNACGIRYKKYRVRCKQCWHIPRKEGHTNTRCFKCGDVLRLSSSHRKHTAW